MSLKYRYFVPRAQNMITIRQHAVNTICRHAFKATLCGGRASSESSSLVKKFHISIYAKNSQKVPQSWNPYYILKGLNWIHLWIYVWTFKHFPCNEYRLKIYDLRRCLNFTTLQKVSFDIKYLFLRELFCHFLSLFPSEFNSQVVLRFIQDQLFLKKTNISTKGR